MSMMRVRLGVQGAVKAAARKLGIDVRYAFQNPPITSAGVYSRWLQRGEVKCVFDVGANVGQSARKFAREFPAATIHSFEPFAATFEGLQAAARGSDGRIVPHPLACSDADGSVDVAVETGSTSQMNQLKVAAGAGDSVERINLTRIDTFCTQHGIERIDILKTDTEGHDRNVLAGASRMLGGGHVRCVISEVGFLDDRQHTSFTEVFMLLREYGFEAAGLYEATYNPSLACDFANALFVRRN